ncbi:MAG: cellulose synthase [Leptothrix sp. (in: Bacteria)]|nr:cellulose synthase [Leptothrix sp. (in: b-proteobacteria)]
MPQPTTRPFLRLVAALVTPTCVAAAALAAPAVPAKPVTAAASAPELVTQSVKLRDIGAWGPIELHGVDQSVYLPMSLRLDETVVGARLKLDYTFSPSLLPELSQLKVLIDDQPLGTVVAQKGALGSPQRAELELDPRYFVDFAKLRLQFIGHYTMDCEFPQHTSLWANVANQSTLELVKRRLVLRDDLALLPAPFFDRRDGRRLELPFVFARQPSLATVKSAGVLASWFGAQASYRGARFPVLYDTLPARHAVVLATNTERPAGLALPQVEVPTLMVMPLPGDPATKLLLVLGKDAAQLEQAALALVLGQAALSGERAEVRSVKLPPPRAAYDAPAMVRTGGVVRLGQLVADAGELQARGQPLQPVRINLRLPADIFTWEAKGMPMELRFRFTPPREAGQSSLAVQINDRYVSTFRLPAVGAGGTGERAVLPFSGSGAAPLTRNLTVPAFLLGSNNQLQFQFDLPQADEGRCRPTQAGAKAALDPDSTLDLSGIEHYAALPNLAFFANSGFPFTKFADLAQTALLLPDQPQAAEVQTALVALGQMGAATGAAATRLTVLPASRVGEAGDRDLLVVAAGAYAPLLEAWGQTLPARLAAGQRAASTLGRLADAGAEWFSGAAPHVVPREGWTELQTRGPLAAISGFESPLAEGRSVVLLNATDAATLPSAAEVLLDAGKVRLVRGDLVLVRGDAVEAFRVGEVYHVGELRWWRWLWFQLHTHPLLLALLGLVMGLALSLIVYRALRLMAARRLAGRG